MNTKYRAYALTEMLVIMVMVVVLITLTVGPLRTMLSDIPRSARACQVLSGTAKALDQLRNDIEQANHITGLNNGVLTLEHPNGPVRYSFADGQITRRPAINDSGTEYTWQLPHLKTETKLWNQNDQVYAVELTTWSQQKVLDRDDVRFKQTSVFFRKGQQR